MSRQRLGWTGWRDLGFFFHWEGILVVVGAVGVAALEFWVIPPEWPLKNFVDDYKIGLMIFMVLLTALPPTVARGFDHLKARQEAARVQIEVNAVLYGVEIRLMNLVSKLREVFGGQISNTYQNHTLDDCKSYFATRAGQVADHDGNCVVEVNYYALRRSASTTSLSRTLFTGGGHPGMRTTFSTARNASPEAKQLVRSIVSGATVFCRDVRDKSESATLQITNGHERPYRTFLSVPVLRDKNSPHGDRVIGMLSVNATHVDAITASDVAIVKVYAWLLAAAFEADKLGREMPRAAHRVSVVGASVISAGMED